MGGNCSAGLTLASVKFTVSVPGAPSSPGMQSMRAAAAVTQRLVQPLPDFLVMHACGRAGGEGAGGEDVAQQTNMQTHPLVAKTQPMKTGCSDSGRQAAARAHLVDD